MSGINSPALPGEAAGAKPITQGGQAMGKGKDYSGLFDFNQGGSMRHLIYPLVLLLTGCAYNLTLHPRGGGDQAKGSFEVGSQTLTVNLNGDTYTGRAIAGSSTGFGIAGTKPVTMIGTTNQRSALLKGTRGMLRCEYVIQVSGGNGVCVDSTEKVYDLEISPH